MSETSSNETAIFEAIFNLSTDGMLVIDRASRIKRLNEAAATIFGYSSDELLGQDMSVLLPEGFQPEHHQLVARSHLEDKRVVNRNRRVDGVRRDGSVFPIEVNICPVPIDGERHFAGIFRDISERVQSERILRRQSKADAVSRLAGGVSHDFNNLLAVILGNLDLLLEEPMDEASRAMLQTIDRTVSRAATLTARLRDFSRPPSDGDQAFVPADVAVTIQDLLPATETDGCNVVIETAEDSWACTANRSDFEGALVALVMNAIDAMPKGGDLTVECRNVLLEHAVAGEHSLIPPGEYVVCSVSDTGCGISPEHRDEIFDPFFSTKYAGEGTGLGLPTVLGFLRRNNGYVKVETTPNEGSRFSLFLRHG